MGTHEDKVLGDISTLLSRASDGAQYQQAVAYLQQGNLKAAESLARKVLHEDQNHADASHLLGYIAIQHEQYELAERLIWHAISINPGNPAYHSNHAIALHKQGRFSEALAACEQAIALNPNLAEAYNNLGPILMDTGKMKRAISAYERAIQLKPDFAEAYRNLGLAYQNMGHLDETTSCYLRALELDPDNKDAYDNLLLSLNYNPNLTQEEIYQAHHTWGIRQAQLHPQDNTSFNNGPDSGNRRLRVGYLSPDFHTHSVAYFLEPLLESHNRKAVEIYCYSNVRLPDITTERLRAKADHWLAIINMTDEAVVDHIQQDRIDILVDLAGHTGGNRLSVFARKPAPILVSWLGYPNTTGMPAMDFRLTDAIADPPGEADRQHTETLVRLENGFLCYRPHESAPGITEPPVFKSGHITFGSFNNLTKINPGVIAAWAETLHSVPESRLLLKNKALADEDVRAHYLELFSGHGITGERIDLYGLLPKAKDHLGLYRKIDIGLDTFPYNGTTTTCEALWMGVPVVTLAGDRHAARVGASILEQVNHPEWVAPTVSSYIETAVHLAGNRDILALSRSGLRERMRSSPLCNTEAFAESIEKAYRLMWKKYVGVPIN